MKFKIIFYLSAFLMLSLGITALCVSCSKNQHHEIVNVEKGGI